MKKKKLYLIIVIALLIIHIPLNNFAHKGRTDSNGGHYNRSTGEYHYHHGYGPHQHIDGICPYEYDDKTSGELSSNSSIVENNNNNSTSSNITKSNSTKEENNILKNIVGILVGCWWLIIPIGAGIYDYIKNKRKEKNVADKDNFNNAENKNEPSKKVENCNMNNKYICPKCGGRLILKRGKYGTFIGCQNYPKCRYTKAIKK